MYIGVAGNIGVGKTTLAKFLADHYKVPLLEESVKDNPFLAKYYGDMKRWAFHTQMYFVNSRVKKFNEHQNIPHAILDRVIEEDKYIFTEHLYRKGFLSNDEMNLYNTFYDLQVPLIRKPDVLVYLRSDVNNLKKNIASRDRPYELDLVQSENTYLGELNDLYEEWISRYTDTPLVIVDTNKENIVFNKQDRENFLSKIEDLQKNI